MSDTAQPAGNTCLHLPSLWPNSRGILPGYMEVLRLLSLMHLSSTHKSILSTEASGILANANPIVLLPCSTPLDGFLCSADCNTNDLCGLQGTAWPAASLPCSHVLRTSHFGLFPFPACPPAPFCHRSFAPAVPSTLSP